MSRTSLETITAESLRDVMCHMGMITSVVEMKKFCVLKTYFYTIAEIKLVFLCLCKKQQYRLWFLI